METVTITKERRIPTTGEVMVKQGQQVEPDTLIAAGTVPSQDIHELRLYRSLNVNPDDVKNHIVKHEGETVEKDEVVAIARSFFGRQTRMARSPIDGVIMAFSSSTGRMMIRGHPVPVEVFSHLPGKVVDIYPDEGAVVETQGYRLNGVFGVSGEAHGILEVAVESGDIPLTSTEILPEYGGKILVGGSVVTLDALRKAVKIGVRGIIVGGVDQKDLTFFLGYEIGHGVTGGEDVGLTLILMEGFGVNPIPDTVFDSFKEFSGKLSCIDGTTHIRSRSLKPEIIIPL
jgi:hypothetical protein